MNPEPAKLIGVCPSCLADLRPHRDSDGWTSFRCLADPGIVPVIRLGERVMRAWRVHRSAAWLGEVKPSQAPIPQGPAAWLGEVKPSQAPIPQGPRVRVIAPTVSRQVRAICAACGRHPIVLEGYEHRLVCRKHPEAPMLLVLLDRDAGSPDWHPTHEVRQVWMAHSWSVRADVDGIPAYAAASRHSVTSQHRPESTPRY